MSGINARGIAPPVAGADARFANMGIGMNNYAIANAVSTPLSRSRARPVQQASQPVVNPLSNFTSTVLMGGNHQRKSTPRVGTVNANAMQHLTSVMMGNTTKRRDNPVLNDKNPQHLQKDFMGQMLFGGSQRAAPKNGIGTMQPIQNGTMKDFGKNMMFGNSKPLKRKPGKYGGML
jgi:hypothetical protein